jgi:hypothetical protein
MIRWASILITVAACASSPPAARLFAAGGGECPTPDGCGVPLGEEPKYAPPDEAHGPPADPNLGPAEQREATCTDVANSAAALEVGNYASDEERLPLARKYRARCLKGRLDRTERQCVFEAADAATIAYCAPRFWPQVTIDVVEPTRCTSLITQLRDRWNTMPGAEPAKKLWEPHLAALQRSCEEDRWTVAFSDCATVQTPNTIAPYCQHVAPAPLLARIEDRLAKVRR